MSKSFLMSLIVVIIVLGGAAVWYFGFYENNPAQNTNGTTNTSTVETNANTLPVKKTEAPIIIFTVEPGSGELSGGNTVSINGLNFVEGAKVFFGTEESASVTFVSQTELSVVVPSTGIAGLVGVKIVNPDKVSGLLQDGYTYQSAEEAADDTTE